MAIFGKNRPQQGAGHGATIIAAGSKLVGNLTLTDRLHVDGRLDGDVESESDVVIGSDGTVSGTVQAKSVVVSGRIEGSISSERLEIIAGGTVEGDVHTVNLVIEPGGRFNGSSEILERSETPAPVEPAAASSTSTPPEVTADRTTGKPPKTGKSAGSGPSESTSPA
ncbi:MAG: bactofilin family protein [Wenzhouxiangellaceae bacterium]